jgi:hypothetical protein
LQLILKYHTLTVHDKEAILVKLNDRYMNGISLFKLMSLQLSPGLVMAAAVLVISDHSSSSILFGQTSYPTAESGQRILLDTKSGLNKNLTAAETQLVGPVLPILEAGASSCRGFILVEQQEGKSISLYQYQSKIPIEVGIPMNLTWLADFDTILDAMAEAEGIKEIVKNKSCE